jgi:adenosyl cobinamide kinase/adenosyl cobinamide phosphate guanylyltransferase
MALVVFTGGARSGKSTAAEELARRRQRAGTPVTVAVFGRPSDPEMDDRISRHRDARHEGFVTLAVADPMSWIDGVPSSDLLLVECLGTWVGRVVEILWDQSGSGPLADAGDTMPKSLADAIASTVDEALRAIVGRRGDTIVVTNEVGDGVVPAFASGRLFRDVLGVANRRLVEAADAAYLCVAGRLIELTTLPRTARWPRD